ncbi:inosine/xanthosine triphosphatase [Candidatus Woesearchaeota archaeon]|nr:inosine/xanthosine triphosphatase [Candidatus Woesearchaeota archaeon]
MVKVLVGSKNPVKIQAVREAFSHYFNDVEALGLKVSSNVPDMPINQDIFLGAENRAKELKKFNKEQNLGADYFVGIEGGLAEYFSKWLCFGTMCIMDKTDKTSYGTSPQFELPGNIRNELLQGVELGKVMDRLTNDQNTKQKAGAIGFFSKNIIDRKSLYVQGLIMALIPFINKELFFPKQKI